LSIITGSPWDDSPDALIANPAATIERTKAKHLVIDGLSAFESKYKNDDMYTIAKRFISLIQQYKITALITILTTQKSGFELSGLGLSSLFQNIILLRYVEIVGPIGSNYVGIFTGVAQRIES
jgi:circadian clock protein KaiC